MALQHLRSSTANKRPTPAGMSDGQLALNTNDASPGLFFKDSNGALVKVGPVHVGTTAPNATPGSGGSSGNAIGEQWLDTTGGTYVFKVWDGSAWRSESGTFVDVNGDVMTGALGIIAGSAGSPGLYFSGDANTGLYSPGADQVAISTGGSGRLFVDASGNIYQSGSSADPFSRFDDRQFAINASSAAQNVALSINAGSTAGRGGQVYLGQGGTRHLTLAGNNSESTIGTASNTPLRFETNASERLRITSAGLVGVGTSSPSVLLDVYGTGSVLGKFVRNNTGGASGGVTIGNNDRTYTLFGDSSIFQLYDNTAATTRVAVDTSGRVGVGTTPSTLLHIQSTDPAFRFKRSDAGTDAYGELTTDTSGLVTMKCDPANAAAGSGFRITVDNSEALRVDSSGRLGIGTSTVNADLHIFDSSGDAEIRITSNASNQAILRFGNTVDQTLGSIRFDSPTDSFQFYGLNDTERLRIDSSGRVGIGTTSASANLHVSASSGTTIKITETNNGVTGALQATSSGPALGSDTNHPLVFYTNAVEKARLTASGQLLVGTSTDVSGGIAGEISQVISSAGGGINLGRNDSTVTVDELLGVVNFYSFGGASWQKSASIKCEADAAQGDNDKPGRLVFSTTADGASSPTERARITSDGYVRLSASSPGIQFGGDTAAANALDDYEEGTFTPTIVGTSTAGTGTYTNQIGRYTKIGNRVTFTIYLNWTAHTGTGNIRVSNLPFTSTSATGSFHAASIYADGIPFTGPWLQAYVGVNSTNIGMGQMTAAGVVSGIPMDSAGDITITGHYEV